LPFTAELPAQNQVDASAGLDLLLKLRGANVDGKNLRLGVVERAGFGSRHPMVNGKKNADAELPSRTRPAVVGGTDDRKRARQLSVFKDF
jgi:hypothetical protein